MLVPFKMTLINEEGSREDNPQSTILSLILVTVDLQGGRFFYLKIMIHFCSSDEQNIGIKCIQY